MQQQQQQPHQPQAIAVMQVGGQPITAPAMYVAGVPPTVTVSKYPSILSRCIGITLIISGTLGFVFNSVDLGVGSDSLFTWGMIAHGYWTGVMCIIAGGFGIGAAKWKTKCQIIAFNVLCIISASFALGQLIVGIMGAIVVPEWGCNWGYYGRRRSDDSCENLRKTLMTMEILLAILAVIDGIFAILGSAICCKAYCCCTQEPNYYMQTMSNNGTPMVVMMSHPQAVISSAGVPPNGFQPVQVVPAQLNMNSPMYQVHSNPGFAFSGATPLPQ